MFSSPILLKEKTKFVIVILAASFLLLLLIFFIVALQPPNRRAVDQMVSITIFRGASLSQIVSDLKSSNLIKAKSAFSLYSILSGQFNSFKPGQYSLSPSWNAAQIARMLAAGPPDIVVRVAEGETLLDIDDNLAQASIIRSGELASFDISNLKNEYDFLKTAGSLEGFLFPDTYHFSQFMPPTVVVKELLNNFQKNNWPLLKKETDFYQALIISSLIEKEAPDFPEDRALISGVIYRRLKLGMPLQLDATIAYNKCGQRFFTCKSDVRRLSKNDLGVDSEFNSYLNKDIPPTPIANPGFESVRAAVNPKASSYLYYISDPRTKRTIFAATLDEHNTNRVKYLR